MKLNNYQIEFINNEVKINEMLFDMADKDINKLMKLHKNDRDKILQEVANIILEYKVTDNVMDLSNIEVRQLNKKITKEIKTIFNEQISLEDKMMNDLLLKLAEDKYYLNSFNLTLGLDFNLKKVESKILNRIVKNTVEGKDFSKRLWTNKNKVAKVLQREINDYLEGKTSINEISNVIKGRFNQNAFNSKRLINNEAARVQSEVNEEWAKDHNIEYQLFMATLDGRTSEKCRLLDGKVYEINDSNKPIPPNKTHIGCRSCLVAIPSKEWRPKKRRDNEIGKTIDYDSYKKWKENIK